MTPFWGSATPRGRKNSPTIRFRLPHLVVISSLFSLGLGCSVLSVPSDYLGGYREGGETSAAKLHIALRPQHAFLRMHLWVGVTRAYKMSRGSPALLLVEWRACARHRVFTTVNKTCPSTGGSSQ